MRVISDLGSLCRFDPRLQSNLFADFRFLLSNFLINSLDWCIVAFSYPIFVAGLYDGFLQLNNRLL